jgi:hypothetical protein
MITYKTLEDGSLSGNGISSIPVSHRFYTQALKQVEEGEAEILPYTEPAEIPLTPLQVRNLALADITYTRPSDGAEIQIRHPDYASDYMIMERAMNKLGEGESRAWIAKDDTMLMVSKEDMEDCMSYGDTQIEAIFTTYMSSL